MVSIHKVGKGVVGESTRRFFAVGSSSSPSSAAAAFGLRPRFPGVFGVVAVASAVFLGRPRFLGVLGGSGS